MSASPLGGTFAALGSLGAVGLDELSSVAGLQTRRDRKYLVPVGALDGLLAGIDARVLDIDGSRAFRYESVYFDTPDLASFLGAARRRPRRFKVRSRTYLDSDLCMLEVKTRDNRGRTVKHRCAYGSVDRSRLTPAGASFVAGVEQVGGLAPHLRPSLTTSYRRATLLLGDGSGRVTVDTELAWEHPRAGSIGLPGLALVETKTTGRPCAFDHVLWGAGCRPVTISKYCTGLAALVPALPANKWHRVLRRHFGR